MFNIKKLACATIVMAAGIANLSADPYTSNISGTIASTETVIIGDVSFSALSTTEDNVQTSPVIFATNSSAGMQVTLTNETYSSFVIVNEDADTLIFTVVSSQTPGGAAVATAVIYGEAFIDQTTEGSRNPTLTYKVSALDAANAPSGVYSNTLIYTTTLP